MAQIVINISDGTYSRCKNERVGLLPFDIPEVCDAIKNGTPLPKGHGDLKDIDAINLYEEDFYEGADYERAIDAIVGAPTIIEADKTESEG